MKDSMSRIKNGIEEGVEDKAPCPFGVRSEVVRVALAETLSTFVMMVFGLGSVAQVVTGQSMFGDFLSINLGFGLGVAMGVHVAGKVSGAHMNAAVSFTMYFWPSGLVAAAPVYAILHYSGGNFTVAGPRGTAGIFATYPAPYISLHVGFYDQVLGTAMLLLCLMALSDQQNQPAPAGSEPVAVGLLVLLIGISLGSNSGYAINPTRDLAPRIFSALTGWGMEVFRAGNGWWWVPVVAPLLGGVVGALIYKVLVELHHPTPSNKKTEKKENIEHVPMEQLKKDEMCV
uniref:Aquaporin-7-like n=1 Tax=Denticeps clupeoides TaxID=299321 RepID=A0AAY4AEK9_9TELE